MMNAWALPETVTVGNTEYNIRSDYRAILDIIAMQNDLELPPAMRVQGMLDIFYVDSDRILSLPQELMEEACRKACDFIDYGTLENNGTPAPRTMDWQQDAPILIPAINTVAGKEIRAEKHLHWWTFLGYYMEIKEGIFSQVLAVRQKRAKGKKLEKYEREFERENLQLVRLREQVSEEELRRRKKESSSVDELFGIRR